MKKAVLVLLMLISLISLMVLASAATNVYVSPSSKTLGRGENAVISIAINTTDSIYAVSFDLLFNPAVIKGLISGDGGFLGKDGASVLLAVNTIDNNAGKFSFAATRASTQVGVTGTGAIANITFNATADGISNLTITNLQIADPNLQPVPSSISNGIITVITNTAPIASNLNLTPALPYKTDNLTGSYNYSDAENNPESGTEIRWYKNNILQSAYNDQLKVPNSTTTKGEVWYFTVKPKDGIVFGILKYSNNVTIRNSAPVLQIIGNKTINENENLQFTVNANDADNDVLNYSATGLPSGASFSNRIFNWTPSFTQAGVYQVTFNVSDGSLKVSEKITITVNNVNRAPVINWSSPINSTIKFREGLQLFFKQIPKDPDNDVMTYSWKLDSIQQTTSQNWTYSPNISQCGNHSVLLTISDTSLNASRIWSVAVYLRGDVNLDRSVNVFDLAALGLAYRSVPGNANWNKNADINPAPGSNGESEGNNLIDIFDLATVGLNYGRSC